MSLFYFLGQKKFYFNFLIAIGLSLFLLWVVLKSMDVFTQHGDVYIVPDFNGQTLEQMAKKGYNDYFIFEIIDSVYFKSREKGTVVLQNPLPGAKVKQGRHMYLTIVAHTPEKVEMPNLKNISLRQALVTLDLNELLVGELEYVQYFARNAVIDQLINDEPVEAGTELLKGTIIDLVLGKGDFTVMIPMPFLIGLKQMEARNLLHHYSLNVGMQYFLDDSDTAHARVYKTDPETLTDEMLALGQSVNIWYRSDELIDFKDYILELKSDTIYNTIDNTQNELNENEF
jgi:beta-lactam-binding protein with PASTA domain